MRSLGLKIDGPSGVTLQLMRENTAEPVAEVLSAESGAFEFHTVLPGQYKIRASHKTFSFQLVYFLLHLISTVIKKVYRLQCDLSPTTWPV